MLLFLFFFQQVTIRSDSWTGYGNSVRCYYSFHAPGATRIRLKLYSFESYNSNDKLKVYIGTGSGSYYWHGFYGDAWENGYETTFETDFMYLYWYTNSYYTDVGFNGYIRREG